eukprot:SAG31_NODE_613_length_13545_cov_10.972557_9_plen_409_part_00
MRPQGTIAEDGTPQGRFAAAAARQSSGDLVGAEELYQELAAELARTLGPEHAETRRSEYHWAVLCEQLGDYEAAAELYRRVDSSQCAVGMPDDHPERLRTKMGLVNVLDEEGDTAAAENLCHAVVTAQEATLGADHQDTLRSQMNLAGLMAECGELDQASELAKNVSERQEKVLGPDHPDTLVTKHNLSALLAEQAALETNSRKATKLASQAEELAKDVDRATERRRQSVQDVRRQLVQIYAANSKAVDVDLLLSKWQGVERQLLADVKKRYRWQQQQAARLQSIGLPKDAQAAKLSESDSFFAARRAALLRRSGIWSADLVHSLPRATHEELSEISQLRLKDDRPTFDRVSAVKAHFHDEVILRLLFQSTASISLCCALFLLFTVFKVLVVVSDSHLHECNSRPTTS